MIRLHDNSQKGKEHQGNGKGATTEREEVTAIQINPAIKRPFELEIKILRDAPRESEKLGEILKVKQEEYEKAIDREEIERLVTGIEMLKFVLFLLCRTIQQKKRKTMVVGGIQGAYDMKKELLSTTKSKTHT